MSDIMSHVRCVSPTLLRFVLSWSRYFVARLVVPFDLDGLRRVSRSLFRFAVLTILRLTVLVRSTVLIPFHGPCSVSRFLFRFNHGPCYVSRFLFRSTVVVPFHIPCSFSLSLFLFAVLVPLHGSVSFFRFTVTFHGSFSRSVSRFLFTVSFHGSCHGFVSRFCFAVPFTVLVPFYGLVGPFIIVLCFVFVFAGHSSTLRAIYAT